jgi:hypothetical protein
VTFANATLTTPTDGIPYATGKVLPSTEADLANVTALDEPTPVPLTYHAALLVLVKLVIAGGPASNTTYVVLQTDTGDGNWLDLAWCVTTSVSNGTLLFFFSAGVAGANAVAQTRANGSAPVSTGSNQAVLGARFRVIGQATLSGGTSPSVTATVRFKLVPLR